MRLAPEMRNWQEDTTLGRGNRVGDKEDAGY